MATEQRRPRDSSRRSHAAARVAGLIDGDCLDGNGRGGHGRSLDKGIARRVQQAVERLADTGAGNVKRLQAIDPPEFRLRVGDYRVRFHADGATITILRVRNRREAYR